MTVAEAAAYLKAKEQDIIALIDGGELKAKKIGSEYRISKSALDAYLNA
jgi:excisionase family DNA binding protein